MCETGVWKRKPTARPTNVTRISVNVVRATDAIVAPVRIAARLIGSERNRSVIPFDMSSATRTVSDEPPKTVVCTTIPGIR